MISSNARVSEVVKLTCRSEGNWLTIALHTEPPYPVAIALEHQTCGGPSLLYTSLFCAGAEGKPAVGDEVHGLKA